MYFQGVFVTYITTRPPSPPLSLLRHNHPLLFSVTPMPPSPHSLTPPLLFFFIVPTSYSLRSIILILTFIFYFYCSLFLVLFFIVFLLLNFIVDFWNCFSLCSSPSPFNFSPNFCRFPWTTMEGYINFFNLCADLEVFFYKNNLVILEFKPLPLRENLSKINSCI